ncbi:FecR family protein [Mucilaginibacter calamicampi]|uniref:FecR family protein n=1 Tax=Mucilaginibacter calamicampi TaxID=1302352 RepID=A0ABW2YRZ2_9SPHI
MEINDDLLVSHILGEVSPATAEEISTWRNSDPANNERYQQFRAIWETSKNINYIGTLDPQVSLQKLKEKAAMQKAEDDKVVPLNRKNSWLKIAAAILSFVGCGLFYLYQRNFKEIQLITKNEVKVDTLSDGSIVTLNKATSLKYPIRFRGKKRNVILTRGEAFFNVAKNKAMPFIISTGSTTIKVVGTSFNVKNKADAIEVIVETGIVQVTRNGNTVSLKPGEKVLVKQNPLLFRKEKNPDRLYNYYRSKEFVADNTPLWRLVEVLNEAYESKIVISRKELNELQLNTTFKDESLDDILVIISRTFGVTVEKKNGAIVIK